jgi:hypothetical protein
MAWENIWGRLFPSGKKSNKKIHNATGNSYRKAPYRMLEGTIRIAEDQRNIIIQTTIEDL